MSQSPPQSIHFVPTEFAGYGELMGFHRQLLFDSVRTSHFLQAVAAVVRPGDVVVDLGSGTGILALAACRAGAARVYAIEHASIVRVAEKLADQNHFADRIVFINADARSAQIPEPFDVIVSECLGLMGIGGTMVPAVMEMVGRGLRPDGRVIPGRISLFLAPVESPLNLAYVNPWSDRGPGDFDFSPLQELAHNNAYISTVRTDDLIADPQQIFDVDLRQATWNGTARAQAVYRVSRPCRFHGYCGWFDTDLADGVRLTTGPGQPSTVWEQLFLPLEREVLVTPEDEIRVKFAVGPSRAGLPVAFHWTTEVVDASGIVKAAFKQTTDRSVPR